MAKNELSKAELYRKERKDRLSKEAKKNAKRNATVEKAKRVALRVVAVVVAVAIILGVAVAIVNNTGSTVFRTKVASVGDYKISSVEFQYYYRTIYNQYYNYASQGYQLNGFDVSKLPEEQEYPNNEAEEETTTAAAEAETDETTEEHTHEEKHYDTWHDFFADATLTQIQSLYMLSTEAEKAGLTLTEAEETEATAQIEEMRKQATESGYTLNAYLSLVYGDGITEKLLKKCLLRDTLAQKFVDYKSEELADGYDDAKVEEFYKENKKTYDIVSFRTVKFPVENKDTAASKKEADAFLAKATSEETFEAAADVIYIEDAIASAKTQAEQAAASGTEAEKVDEAKIKKQFADSSEDSLMKGYNYETAAQNGAKIADWLFADGRKAGDKAVVEGTDSTGAVNAYFVLYMVKTPAKNTDHAVDVRHILFNFTENNSATPTDEQKAAAKKKAEDALAAWKAGDATEDSFAALANEKSEDPGSNTAGGLYEGVVKGQMVENFENWCFDSSRKTGDYGIVETEYGYHVMYFVEKNDKEIWNDTVRTAMAKKDYSDFIHECSHTAEYELEERSFAYKSAMKKVSKSIKQYLYNISQSSQNSGSASY